MNNFLIQRIVCFWNELPWEAIEVDTVMTFMDRIMDRRDLKKYVANVSKWDYLVC